MKLAQLALLPILATCLGTPAALAEINLTPLGTYTTGVFEEGAAEIVAHDPGTQRLFVINANAVSVDVLSIRNPAMPAKVGFIDASSFGSAATSVAVNNGVAAVSIAAAIPTNPGVVVFFDTRTLRLLNRVTVGVLPDMVTFSKNGRWVLTANEGQPSDDYTIDPEGSVSIINMAKGAKRLKQSDVRNATFTAFNGKVPGVDLDDSIRIFGPNATVAQDLEPEYVAISDDFKTAYVTCQENNAIAVVDIASATVTALRGLGFKDHGRVDTALNSYALAPLPLLGTTPAGQDVHLGGLSGLHFEGTDPMTGNLKFVANTDRGPNAESFAAPAGNTYRPFLLPDFSPELVRLELTPAGVLSITDRIQLKDSSGSPLTGLPNIQVTGGNANSAHNDEIPVDLAGNILTLDPQGGDFEGVVADEFGNFWLCDEYRPAIYKFDSSGKLSARYVPAGAAAAAGQPPGTFGSEVLPAVLAQRRQNRGFEAIAYSGGKIYAWVQSPLRNPITSTNGALNSRQVCRMLELDTITLATKQYAYAIDNPNLGTLDNTRPDKIGDAVALGGGEFLVVERDDDAIDSDPATNIEKKIYRINLAGATDISGLTGPIGATGKLVDELTAAELAGNGITAVGKVLHVDLNAAGYNEVEKVEGLALIDPNTIAVVNDNDFGVAGITLPSPLDGTFTPDPSPEPVKLGIISLGFDGLDASDKDNLINIRQWPVLGMYQPDSIATFKTKAGEFYITANEGDARDYEGFSEETRVGSLTLDPTAFPFGRALKNSAQLGRLRVTNATGNADGDSDFDQLYAFGARSFSIWKTDGTLVFDSLDGIEQLIAADPVLQANFNANHASNTFDDRSDDKGPEPEGIAIGKIGRNTYAFVCLERISGILVLDLSDPAQPVAVQYVSNRKFAENPSLPDPLNPGKVVSNPAAGDLGPEGLIFIPAEQSPIRKPLLVVGNEVSGSTTVYKIEWCDDRHDDDHHHHDDNDDDDRPHR